MARSAAPAVAAREGNSPGAVPYQPGTLKAVGYNRDSPAAECVVETAGDDALDADFEGAYPDAEDAWMNAIGDVLFERYEGDATPGIRAGVVRTLCDGRFE